MFALSGMSVKKISYQTILDICRKASVVITEWEAKQLALCVNSFALSDCCIIPLAKPMYMGIEEYNQNTKPRAEAIIHQSFFAGYQFFLINGIGGWEGNPNYEPDPPNGHFWCDICRLRVTLELSLPMPCRSFRDIKIKSDLRGCPLIPYLDKTYLRRFFETPQIILGLASDPATPLHELVSIFCQVENREVYSLLARNPNASVQLLKMLAPSHINEILLNPVIDLLLLEGTELDDILLGTNDSPFPPITSIKKAPLWLEDWIKSGMTKHQAKLAILIPYEACSDSFNKWCTENDYDIPF